MNVCQCCHKAGEAVAKVFVQAVELGQVVVKEVCRKCLKPIPATGLGILMALHGGAHLVNEYGVPRAVEIRPVNLAAVTSGQQTSGVTVADFRGRW